MVNIPPKVDMSKVREKVFWEFQISDQIKAVTNARNSGNHIMLNNTLNGLYMLLRPWMSKADKELYDKVSFSPYKVEDLYTTEDKRFLKVYSELSYSRIQEIKKSLRFENHIKFSKCLIEQNKLLMDVCKKLGMGLEETIEGVL